MRYPISTDYPGRWAIYKFRSPFRICFPNLNVTLDKGLAEAKGPEGIDPSLPVDSKGREHRVKQGKIEP